MKILNWGGLWRCIALAAGLCLACAVRAGGTQSLNWPSGQIDWVVGFAPGGTADILTRIAARQLGQRTGLSVVVENRPGASGVIALNYVARGPAGTLITVPGPILFGKPEPEVGKQLLSVGLMAQGPMVIVAGARKALPTLQAVIDDARRNPDRWSFASSGTGTSQHLAGELLNLMAHVHIQHVPYKGGSQAVNDVIGGQIPLAILGSAPLLPHIRSGALKAYAVTTSYRVSSLPDVPTMEQLGFKGYDASQWFGVAVSKGTPEASIRQLNAILQDIFRGPEFRKAVDAAGMLPGSGSADDFLQFYRKDTAKWRDVVAKAHIVLGN